MTFVLQMMISPLAMAAQTPFLGLPAPGAMVDLSPAFKPVMVKGLSVHPENPLMFDFIVSSGDTGLKGMDLKDESQKLIKYFLACLTVPESNWWVNLSPYENNKIVAEDLGQTDLGRDMLAQDYLLKQVTASLIYPEKKVGKNFWDRVYQKAQSQFGTNQIPVNTFNKVWVLADKAEVLERNNTAFVVGSHLKVMLDSDYLALNKNTQKNNVVPAQDVASQMMRQIVIPELEREVNTGKNFAQLRQIYNALILANWYKVRLKDALLNQVYANQGKVSGIDLADKNIKEKIYQRYLAAYKKGAFNYIKEEAVAADKEPLPRKYFSGGLMPGAASKAMQVRQNVKSSDVSVLDGDNVQVTFVLGRNNAMLSFEEQVTYLMNLMSLDRLQLISLWNKRKEEFRNQNFQEWILMRYLDASKNEETERSARYYFGGLSDLIEGIDFLKDISDHRFVLEVNSRLNRWKEKIKETDFNNVTPEEFLNVVDVFLNKISALEASPFFTELPVQAKRKIYFNVNQVVKAWLEIPIWGDVKDVTNNTIKNKLDDLWNRAGLVYEMDRIEKVIALTKGKSKDELSKGQVISDNQGNLKWVIYTPDNYSPYEADAGKEIVDLKTPEMVVGLIKAHGISLDSDGNIVLPEEVKGVKVREFMTKLGLTKLDDVVKLENDLRKTLDRLGKIKSDDSQQFLTEIHGFNINVTNKEKSIQILRSMIDLTYRLKIYFNWQIKKDRLANDESYQQDLNLVQARLNQLGFSVETGVLSASIQAMNIPIKQLSAILEGNGGGLVAIDAGKKLLEKGLIREVPFAAGAASRYGVSLKEFSDIGWITPAEYAVLKDLPRSLAAKWNALGDTGVELMIANLLKIKKDGSKVSLSIAVNAATWDQILPFLYQRLKGSGIKLEVMMQNFGKAPLYDGKDYVIKDGQVEYFPLLKPLGHGNISGRFSDSLESIKNGRVYDVTHSADNPTSRMTDAVLGLVGAMSERISAFGAIVNGRNIGQGGGGAVSIKGVGSIIDLPIPNVENSNGFNPNRDITYFNTFIMAMNNVAALYAVSDGMKLVTWDQVEKISKGDEKELSSLLRRLSEITPEQEFLMTERFNRLLPSNYVEKVEKVDGKELRYVQWEQISGEFQGALDKKIRERIANEGMQLSKNTKLGIIFADISLQEWRLLTNDGNDLDAVYRLPLPAFAEVKTAVDLEIFSPIVEKIISEYRRRGVLPEELSRVSQVTTRNAAMTTSPSKMAQQAKLNPGGIDFNPKNLGMTVAKQGDGVKITINPAEVERMKREGVRGFTPIIINIVPITNILPLLGLEGSPRREVEQIAGV